MARYHRIAWDWSEDRGVVCRSFYRGYRHPPKQIILDLDATDDPLHAIRKGASFAGALGGYPVVVFGAEDRLHCQLQKLC